jgi:hypothetical protein
VIERQAVLSTSEYVLVVRASDREPLEAEPWDGNTLVELSADVLAEGEFWIRAGDGFANALVTTRLHDAEPGEPASEWEDVVELSFASRAPVGVTDLIENDPWVALTDEPGEYRLRVSARSRLVEMDPEDDLEVENPESAVPAEFYLLDVWRAPRTEPAVRRLTGAFARHQLEGPPPPLPETDEGLAAAARIGRDLDQAPGARQLSGATESIEVVRTVPGTRRRLFVTCAHLTSFSTMVREGRGWIRTGMHVEEPGAQLWCWGADEATVDRLIGSRGAIYYRFLSVDRPRTAVRAWNWLRERRTPPREWPPVLAGETIVTTTLTQSRTIDGDPQTEIKIVHEGLPVEWAEDMQSWWGLQLAIIDQRRFGVAKK